MTNLVAVPRYEDDCAVVILSCGHGRLVRKNVGRVALSNSRSPEATWRCPVCDNRSRAIDVIERGAPWGT